MADFLAAARDVEVRPGVVQVVEGHDPAGARHVLIVAGLRPYPWTTLASRSRKVHPFGVWQETTRAMLKAALVQAGVRPYPAEAVLGLAAAFGATLAAPLGGRRRVSVLDWDYTNLLKAAEDVCKGILWRDDRQVRYHGPGSAVDATEDWISWHLWGGGKPWESAWAECSVPVVEVATRAPTQPWTQ